MTDIKTKRLILDKYGKKDPLAWFRACSFDWLIIIATLIAAWILQSMWFNIFAIFVLGNRQHALALLGHDGTHRTISKNQFLNDRISDLFAFWPVGLTTTGYRFVHFKHHAHLNTDQDPELHHRSSKCPQWDLPITPKKILKLVSLDLVGYSISDYLMIIKFAQPDKKWERASLILLHITFVVSLVSLGYFLIPILWYVSLLTTFMMFFRLRTWTEHQGSEFTHKLKLNWLGNAVLAPHQSWHHYEHHLFPTVPYNKLKYVRQILGEDETTSIRELLQKYTAFPVIKSGTPTKQP